MSEQSEVRTKRVPARLWAILGFLIGPLLLFGFIVLSVQQYGPVVSLIETYGLKLVASTVVCVAVYLIALGQGMYWISVGGPSNA